jgi:hypothetical protein
MLSIQNEVHSLSQELQISTSYGGCQEFVKKQRTELRQSAVSGLNSVCRLWDC